MAQTYIGTWEVLNCLCVNGTGTGENNDLLEGTHFRFRLDPNGDVTWIVPEELKAVPLFSCETYEVYTTSVLCIRFGAYAGHILEFKADQLEPVDTVVLTCKGLCMLNCQKVFDIDENDTHGGPFSLYNALEEGCFSDISITALNKKELKLHSIILKLQANDIDWTSKTPPFSNLPEDFKLHSIILKLQANDIDWTSKPPPFSNLPEDVIETIMHYLYAECLPENLTEVAAKQVLIAASPYCSLNKLVELCKTYLKNMELKQQIIGLVNDMHSCMCLIIEHFNQKPSISSEGISSNPSKLCFVVKQTIRDIAVAGVKMLLLCDLFTKRKSELSKSERHEIIKYAKSRLSIFFTQLTTFLQVFKFTFSSMSPVQRNEVATFLVPEIEVILDTISTLFVQVEKCLEQIIQELSPDVSRHKTGVGDMLGKYLHHVLHIRELTKLRNFHEHITCSLVLLLHKRESFIEMTHAEKVRSISRNLEQLIEDLPIFLLRLEEDKVAIDETLEWREFKFCFKVGTSKIAGVLQKLVAHRETFQDVMLQLCELVQRDAFTQALHTLGLLVKSTTTAHGSDGQKSSKNCSGSTHSSVHNHGYKLNLVESLSVPPLATSSNLANGCLHLLQNEIDTDMEFEVMASPTNTVDFDSSEEPCSPIEGECTIKAHRVIVAARCDWFRRALNSGMREAILKKIAIHDTSPFLFRIFLEYLYSGRLKENSLSIEQLIELLLLSDRYELDSLKLICEYGIQSSIDCDSALYFLSMADQYNANVLKASCLKFISKHQELTECELFFELPISLQVDIFDSLTIGQLLPTSSNTKLQKHGIANLQKAVDCLLSHDSHHSNSGSVEDLPLAQNNGRLNTCITQLRDIVGDTAPRDQLVQVILAADFDLCRAVNYFYAGVTSDE